MNEKKTFKQAVKEWWDENGRVIKTGVVCGALGLAYGFIKGGLTVAGMRLEYAKTLPQGDDDFEYTEENVDDPELLELIRSEEGDS